MNNDNDARVIAPSGFADHIPANAASAPDVVEFVAPNSALSVSEHDVIPARSFVTPQERAQQCRDVIKLIESGLSENKACQLVGINRVTFKVGISHASLVADYARAMVALAAAQVAHIDEITAKLEAKEIAPDAARVIIDARKWFASKFLPKQYGEHRTVEHTGSVALVPGEMTEEQIRERLAQLDSRDSA